MYETQNNYFEKKKPDWKRLYSMVHFTQNSRKVNQSIVTESILFSGYLGIIGEWSRRDENAIRKFLLVVSLSWLWRLFCRYAQGNINQSTYFKICAVHSTLIIPHYSCNFVLKKCMCLSSFWGWDCIRGCWSACG